MSVAYVTRVPQNKVV